MCRCANFSVIATFEHVRSVDSTVGGGALDSPNPRTTRKRQLFALLHCYFCAPRDRASRYARALLRVDNEDLARLRHSSRADDGHGHDVFLMDLVAALASLCGVRPVDAVACKVRAWPAPVVRLPSHVSSH